MWISSQLLPQPSGGGRAEASLYLRHLGEQADGHGEGEAEGNQAHEAVDGQQQSAVALQKSQPTQSQQDKRRNVSPLGGSIPDDYCAGLFLDLEKSIMCRFGMVVGVGGEGGYFHN